MKDYEEQTKKLYNEVESPWSHDPWNDYTQKMIKSFIHKYESLFSSNSVTINAGSGGSSYGLKNNIYHIDIAKNLLKDLSNAKEASVEDIPYEDSKFNCAICVGSVINYCNVLTALHELSRVLNKKSILILEYERSQTGELLFNKEYNKNSSQQTYNYNNQTGHNLWLYSDNYINSILTNCGFRIVDEIYYHSVSAIVNRIIHNEENAGKIAFMDKMLIKPLKKMIAHNRILLCKRN